jgi:hypothetical protein
MTGIDTGAVATAKANRDAIIGNLSSIFWYFTKYQINNGFVNKNPLCKCAIFGHKGGVVIGE